MTSLVIVESPAKAKTISRFLGSKYRVEASFGHIRDLAAKKQLPDEVKGEKWAEFGVNTEKNFEPYYVISEDKEKQIRLLKAALKDADELLLATDEDREGESISWHLLEVLKPKVPVKRIVFHEITKEAILEAVANARDVDMHLVHAQEGRRILDRLFGYKLSPVLWRKVQPGLSAGRVQSVAVRLIVEREEERKAFRSSTYWDLEAEIGSGVGPFKATLTYLGGKRLASGKDFDSSTGKLSNDKVVLLDKAKAEELRNRVSSALPWKVKSVEEKPATQRPYPPFTTSTLQQEANRKLGYGSKRTMQIAQKLYEGVDIGEGERVGLITYMRTDSVTLSDKALRDSQKVIRDLYGADYAKGPRPYKTKQANAQEAHEAVRPTEVSRRPQDVRSYLEKDELALYELIWKRTIASQMPDAQLQRTTVEIAATSPNGAEAIFSASGKKIMFPGFLRAYVEGSDDPTAEIGDQEVILPDLKVGDLVEAKGKKTPSGLNLLDLGAKEHITSPPARYSEASLVKKLEEEGVGRPSTYASIIGTIQDRGYVFLNKSKQLVPTFTAFAVIKLLREHFPEYVDLKFTARMEEELDLVSNGEMTWVDHVRTFFRGTKELPGLEQLVELKQNSIDFPDLSLGIDPDTKSPVTVRIGRYGPYLMRGENGNAAMANIPQDMAPADLSLEEALRLINNKAEGPRELGNDPVTGLPVLAMSGRFGAYVQLGETPEDKKAPKPRRASLEKGMSLDTVALEDALRLLSLPRTLGTHPETGEPVIANNGRFGPYVGAGKEFRSLKAVDNVFTVTFERALELIKEPKGARGARGTVAAKNVIKELGKTEDGLALRVLEGRYGPYISDGKRNANVPKGTEPEAVTLEQGVALLNERDGKAKPAKGKAKATAKAAPAKKAAPKKTAAKKK